MLAEVLEREGGERGVEGTDPRRFAGRHAGDVTTALGAERVELWRREIAPARTRPARVAAWSARSGSPRKRNRATRPIRGRPGERQAGERSTSRGRPRIGAGDRGDGGGADTVDDVGGRRARRTLASVRRAACADGARPATRPTPHVPARRRRSATSTTANSWLARGHGHAVDRRRREATSWCSGTTNHVTPAATTHTTTSNQSTPQRSQATTDADGDHHRHRRQQRLPLDEAEPGKDDERASPSTRSPTPNHPVAIRSQTARASSSARADRRARRVLARNASPDPTTSEGVRGRRFERRVRAPGASAQPQRPSHHPLPPPVDHQRGRPVRAAARCARSTATRATAAPPVVGDELDVGPAPVQPVAGPPASGRGSSTLVASPRRPRRRWGSTTRSSVVPSVDRALVTSTAGHGPVRASGPTGRDVAAQRDVGQRQRAGPAHPRS